MWPRVMQNYCDLTEELFSFKFAVSVQDAGMAGCMLRHSLDQKLVRLGEICHEFSVHLIEIGEI